MTTTNAALQLLESANSRDERALARLLSMIETERSTMTAIQPALAHIPATAHIIGITGAPAVGKSTLVSALIDAFRARGQRIAVVAIDPSSPFTGGALLGDRIRMQTHFLDRDVYIRSMSSRGHSGGLASATPDVIDVLARCGFDLVFVETVGVGQVEVEIAAYADTVVVVLAAGGDSVQAAKAGILEAADVLVVNKAERDGSSELAADLREMLSIGSAENSFRTGVIEVEARDRVGIDELESELERHRGWLDESGERDLRRHRRVLDRLRAIVADLALARVAELDGGDAIKSSATRVAAGELDIYTAAGHLLSGIIRS